MFIDHENPIVGTELQMLLDHIAGPKPAEALHKQLHDDIAKTYCRTTWFNGVCYLQDHGGRWAMAYCVTSSRARG